MLLNLLSNALKFTPKNGEINIQVKRTFEKTNNIADSNLEVKDVSFLQVSVQDNGVGIKKKNHEKMFKLFGSQKDENKKINTEGIGLGLMISKMIVENF